MRALFHVLGLLLLTAVACVTTLAAVKFPELNDPRLRITLYASDPDIVTPIGCVVDAQGRLFVIESHTHSPPQDYSGPKRDIIRVFEGNRADGRFAKSSVFADGIFQAQSIDIAPTGEIYVVCTREVLILHDRDQDGRSETRTRILHLDPFDKRGNPHGQMMAIAFSNDGWLYVATGTTSDDWIGSDEQRLVVGPYWGGIIARCRPDGTRLERIAWGFWNPFSMTFDRYGRLIAVDNDPDHRGPNRLLHIVYGGDYGFKKTYGRFGLHPYQAWEGELPGTLPMISGIGEAPTAVIDANRAALPPDYHDTIIGATWGEHNLTLFRPKPSGASLTASHTVFLKGLGHDEKESPFRPSGMAASPFDGSIYVTDWMLIDYTTHQRGRIWRISTAPGVPTTKPRPPYAPLEQSPELARMASLYNATHVEAYPLLIAALREDDPFLRNAAVTALSRPSFHAKLERDLEHEDQKIRLGALLALRRADVPNPTVLIEPRLADPDSHVALMAMIWAGEKKLRSLAGKIEAAASKANLDKTFFQTWLATMQIMQNAGEHSFKPEFLEQLAHDETRPLLLRAIAIRWLPGIEKPENHRLLVRLARSGDPSLQLEAIRRFAESTHAETTSVLRDIAMNEGRATSLRAEALAALAGNPDTSLLPLLNDHDPIVRLETSRTLRRIASNRDVAAAARKKLTGIQDDSNESSLKIQLEFLLDPEAGSRRPASLQEWQKLLANGGDADAGRRVFFSANSACSTCHASEGRGIKPGLGNTAGFVALRLGPDLSVIGRTAKRDAIIHSIVKPSDYIAPEYQGWFVKMKNGEIHTGREIDQEDRGIQLIMLDGHEHDFPQEQITTWGAMENSLMPEGLAHTMSLEEFRDLVAYLESLR